MGAPAELLGADTQLDRERAIKALQQQLAGGEPDVPSVVATIERLMAEEAWQHRLSGLLAAKVVLQRCQESEAPGFVDWLLPRCIALLEDGEVRVRLAVGECLEALAARRGPSVWEACQGRLLESIRDNFDREGEGDKAEPPDVGSRDTAAGPGPGSRQQQQGGGVDLIGALLASTYKPQRPGHGELRHGTEGWKCLETSYRALAGVLAGCGPAMAPHLTRDLRDVLYRALLHPNRFVREAGYDALAAVSAALAPGDLAAIATELGPRLVDGLSDNWSQVRYAACVATRAFLLRLGDCLARQAVLPLVIGPICIQRYYVAEGVRRYAQETWSLVVGDNGRQLVADHAAVVAAHYVAQTKAGNHAAREAACACIAELAEKVDRASVAPHVPALLSALLLCFRDLGWPVRDAACVAAGRCVVAFPLEARALLEDLYGLWVGHLWDNVPSVREDAALALGQALRAYGQEALDRVLPAIRELLPKAHEQEGEVVKYGGREGAAFGPDEAHARDNDPAVHTGQDSYSCGSMARFNPNYALKSDGCMPVGYSRDKQPWEASDGAVYMVRELAAQQPAAAAEFLPALAQLARLVGFARAWALHETIWKALPAVAAAMGARAFKPHLDAFLGPAFADLRCGHQLAEVAAGRCIGALRDLVGPRTFAGRLTPEQQAQLASDPNIPPPRQAGAGAGAASAGVLLPHQQQQRAAAGMAVQHGAAAALSQQQQGRV